MVEKGDKRMKAVWDALVIEPPVTSAVDLAEPSRLDTTLFDLIAALQDTVGPGDDATLVAAVTDLVQTGRIRFRVPVAVNN
jgi:hypothetical protein